MPENENGRPGRGGRESSTPIKNGTSLPLPTDHLAPLEAMSRTLRHPRAIVPAFVVFLMRRDRSGWRRQVYVSLAGANKALDRARANGVEARIQLVELVPVPHAPVVVIGGGDE